MEPDLVPRHPIRVVARRTGLTPAAIRAWERRYGAVAPSRSEGGQRLYTDRDLARLDMLRRLTDAGRSISAVAALSPDEAAALLEEDRAMATASQRAPSSGDAPDLWTEQAYARLRALDDAGLDSALRRALASLGAHRFLVEVAAPLLGRVGAGWVAGEVTKAQEHMGSAVIERILAEVADQAATNEEAARLVVATLPGERHALGARLVAAVGALEGWRVSYLGVDLPPVDIAAAAVTLGAKAVAISMVADEVLAASEPALAMLRQQLDSEIELLVGGRASHGLDPRRLPQGIVLLRDLQDLRTHLLAAR